MSYKVVSLFSGCGGLDLGFINTGFEVVWANDCFGDAVNTYKKNIGNHIVHGDITKISSVDIPNDFDVLLGGFPCQGFSIANSKRSMKDSRNYLYLELLRIVKDKKPKIFVAENVKGLLSMLKGEVIKIIIKDFEEIGYKVDYKLLKASDYGVPQHRERVIIIGNRINKTNIFPIPTYGNFIPNNSIFEEQQNILPYLNVKDVIKKYAKLRTQDDPIKMNSKVIYNHTARTNVADTFWGRKHKVNQDEVCDYLKDWRTICKISTQKIDKLLGYKHTAGHWFRKDSSGSIPSPQDWVKLKEIMGFDNKYDKQIIELELKKISFEQSLRISNWDTPSDTITASGPEIHPNKQRRLSVRECAILQTFPNDFIFTGSLGNMYKQIGNAVPVKMAEAIAKIIIKQL